MKALSLLLKTSWQKLLIGALASALSAGCYALGIRELNEIIKNQVSDDLSFIKMFTLVFASAGLSILAGFYLTRLYERIVADIRIDLAEKILMADFEVIERNSYRILPVIDTDVNVIGRFAKLIPDILVAAFKVLAIVIYMYILSWQLTVSIILIFLAVFLVSWVFIRKLLNEERQIRVHRNMLYRHLIGLVNGVKELSLNAMHRVGYVKNTIAESNSRFAHHMTISGSLNITVIKLAEFMVVIGLGAIILLFVKNEAYSSNLVLEFFALVLFILPSLIVIITFFRGLKRVDVCVEQIRDLSLEFDTQHDHVESVHLIYKSKPFAPLIDLKNIAYKYKTSKEHAYQVGSIDLEILENQVLIINGGNGSGKTTFSKILCGLYKPNSGSITFQGQEVLESTLFSYRDMFSAVFADSHVFDDLRYLNIPPADDRFEKYASMLQLDTKVSLSDLRLSTVDLSFGQRGRLNLLRALLEDKPIYLFDEWAANQDPYFKSKFYLEIIPMLKNAGKTVIAISHDDHYYHVADRVVTFCDGAIEAIKGR